MVTLGFSAAVSGASRGPDDVEIVPGDACRGIPNHRKLKPVGRRQAGKELFILTKFKEFGP